MQFDLAIAYRATPLFGKKHIRFESKYDLVKASFDSLARSLEGVPYHLTVILDDCPKEYEGIFREKVSGDCLKIIHTDKIGNSPTFLLQLSILLEQTYADYLYFAEDDYFYIGKFSEMLQFMKSNSPVDFVSPYDHPDLHIEDGPHRYEKMKIKFGNREWKDVMSTCCTFLTSKKMVKSPEKLAFYADMAYMAERKILGINCGQMDQYSSAFGGILHMDCYQEPPLIHPLKPNVDLPLVIGDTLQTKNTPKILGWLKERRDYKEPRFMEGVEEISNIVKEAKKELEKEKPSREKIGELMNLNQHYLSKNLKVSGDCPISPSKLDVLIDASLKAGALGAKLSGSGGGGTMVALCNSEDMEKVAKAIEGIGGKAYITHVAEEGFKIEQSSE